MKPEVERLITLAKRGDLHARRQALSALGQDKFMVYKLFEEIAPRYTDRPGGYTRILKLGPRKSDAAEMALAVRRADLVGGPESVRGLRLARVAQRPTSASRAG